MQAQNSGPRAPLSGASLIIWIADRAMLMLPWRIGALAHASGAYLVNSTPYKPDSPGSTYKVRATLGLAGLCRR